MSAPVQPMNTPPSANAAVNLLTYGCWFIAAMMLVLTLCLASWAIADRNSDREPGGLVPALMQR